MAAKGQLQKIWSHKTSDIIQTSLLHSTQFGDVQVIFQGFTEIQNGRHGIDFNFFDIAKT